MRMREFISRHRTEIDDAINAAMYRYDGKGGRGTIPTPAPTRNDDEREQWIMNDESLYNWARREGVRV